MSADFNSSILVRGTINEIKKVLSVLRELEENDDIYLDMVQVGKKADDGYLDESTSEYLSDIISDDEVEKLLASIGNELAIEAAGPYGEFGSLDETNIFELIANAAPESIISGTISGFNTDGSQSIVCRTDNGKLHLTYKFVDDYAEDDDVEISESIYNPATKKYKSK